MISLSYVFLTLLGKCYKITQKFSEPIWIEYNEFWQSIPKDMLQTILA